MRDWDEAVRNYRKKINERPGQDPGEPPPPPSPPPSPDFSPSTSTLLAPQASYPFQIKDTFARVLKVESTSASRTAIHFRNQLGDVIDDEKTIVRSDPQRIAIPSTKVPARVAPLTILPAFALRYGREQARSGRQQVYTVKREVRLRVRMQRPWFSSGAGERLGLVIWPPEIASSGPLSGRIDDSHNVVVRDYNVSRLPFFSEKPDIDMQAFSDADLGPGGAFITRWGADPVKREEVNVGWLMPPESFGDLRDAAVFGRSNQFAGPAWMPEGEGADEQEYVYVPRVDMPVPDGDANPQQKVNNKEKLPPKTISVALVTYKPRFDVDTETWFADVAIDAGGMHEPFIRLGLVRFQANAPATLRVSEPVTEWVQVLPKREAQVSVDKSDPCCIHVTVKGRGHVSSENQEGFDPLRLDGWRQRPLMRVSVLRTDANGFETTALLSDAPEGYQQDAARTWIPRTLSQWIDWLQLDGSKKPDGSDGGSLRPYCALHPATKNGELIWRTSFNLSEEIIPRVPGAPKFAVFLEEVEAMRPATLPNEPVDPSNTTEDWLEISGPRFAARISIE
jgi:hypothetical protein